MIDKLKINVRGKNVRVVRVTGAYIESWRTEDPDKNVTKNSRDSSPKYVCYRWLAFDLILSSPIPDKVLIIQLKNSIPNDKYQIILSTEQDVGEQEQLVLPTFEVRVITKFVLYLFDYFLLFSLRVRWRFETARKNGNR